MREITDDGGVVCVLFANTFSHGWPDRLITHRLWRGLLELKAHDGSLRDNQRKNIRDLRRRDPASAFVIREPSGPDQLASVEDADDNVLLRFRDGAELMRELHLIDSNVRAARGY